MSIRYMAILCALVFTTVITGCPKKQTIVSEASKNAAADEATMKREAEEGARKEAEAKARAEEESKKQRAVAERTRMENAARAGALKAFQARDVHFDYDRYDIKTNDRESLKEMAEWLLKEKDARVVIEGHADERGSSEYNLALGERRAHSVKEYLAAIGVSESRITSIGFGEERPLCSESAEDCWWKNRRGHLVIK